MRPANGRQRLAGLTGTGDLVSWWTGLAGPFQIAYPISISRTLAARSLGTAGLAGRAAHPRAALASAG